ncbi:TPA: cytochrome b562 [Escherichia coli]|uniref:cytochrome b562 n=1 Tax=Escherichia coli TaxID=562 RepID=UPI0006AC9C90|nr:cytochrome b562 [Escherichia coli]EFG1570146.1 hypothetical protein [Escherichia coli]EGM7794531.1 hypothetical protein [Escherichia coli]EHX1940390.1 hypothetical protein [Escherichia coli]EHX8709928.1 hypothetical protein [Escherichia coli]MBF5314925.1 hypothetical protein [Escherichia coli]
MKKMLMLTGVMCLSIPFHTHAADLSEDMLILSQNLNIISKSESDKEIITALDKMYNAAVDAMEEIPESSSYKDINISSYKNDMNKLIDVIEKAKNEALEGDLSKVKSSIKEMIEIRDSSHKKYR